jgi:hypothetical protein
MCSIKEEGTVAPREIGAFEIAQALEDYHHDYWDADLGEPPMVNPDGDLDDEDTFTGLLLSFWEYLDEVYWEDEWDLTKVLNKLHAVPTMDWVYGMGYSSLGEQDQLRVRAMNLSYRVSASDPDWGSDPCFRLMFGEEAREILTAPRCSNVLSPDALARTKEIVRLAEESSQLAAA